MVKCFNNEINKIVVIDQGISIGVHRLYSHKAFEANRVIRFILLYLFSFSAQHSLYDWVRYHRVHHKYADTEADPHNSKRGIFYCHIGWIYLRKTEEFEEKG